MRAVLLDIEAYDDLLTSLMMRVVTDPEFQASLAAARTHQTIRLRMLERGETEAQVDSLRPFHAPQIRKRLFAWVSARGGQEYEGFTAARKRALFSSLHGNVA